MFTELFGRAVRVRWLWIAPYMAIGVFALSMLGLTAMLQLQERRTADAAVETDIQWAERTMEARMIGHQDFLAELDRELEQGRLTPTLFTQRASAYLYENPDIVAIMRIDADGRIAWLAPDSSGVAKTGEHLSSVRQVALEAARANGRFAYSPPYSNGKLHHAVDLVRVIQRGAQQEGALIAVHSLENLLNATLPGSFSTKYGLALEDDAGNEIISNANLTPTGRAAANALHLRLLDSRLGLRVLAYRTGSPLQAWLPSALILFLTFFTAWTLVQLRQHALRRARDEAQLRSDYAFRQAMSESLLTGIRAIDMAGRITYVNKAFCQMVGWQEHELLGMEPPFPYWPPEETERLHGFVARTLAGEAALGRSETRIMHRDGRRLDVSVYVSALIDASGRQLGWMVGMNDITEQKRIRDELRQAQERFLTVLDGLDSAVHVVDVASGEILFANRAFCTLFAEDAVGKTVAAIAPALQPPAERLLRDPTALLEHELPSVLFDDLIADDQRWYRLHSRAIRWVDGRTVCVQIATDITERKNIDDLNRQQQKRVEETSRLIGLGEMASSLAHELNQPLAAIANYTAGCVKRIESGQYRPEDLLGALHRTSEQAQRAGTIIQRMRDMVRKSDPQLQPLALTELIEETLALGEIEARRWQARLEIDLPVDLPKVIVDRIMIEQVLLNLVKNGLEAMQTIPAEARCLHIGAALRDDRQVEVTVSDNGIGLQERDLEKVFTPFYTTKPEGLGIGLAICRSIVEFHQGRLWAETLAGRGTAFKFTLPREI